MYDDEARRRQITWVRWVAIASVLLVLASYLFPYMASAEYWFHYEELTGLKLILRLFQMAAHVAGTALPLYWGSILLFYLAPLALCLFAGVALWGYYYKACAFLSFLSGALRILLSAINAAGGGDAQFRFGWWLGMLGCFACGGAARWIAKKLDQE